MLLFTTLFPKYAHSMRPFINDLPIYHLHNIRQAKSENKKELYKDLLFHLLTVKTLSL